MSVLDDVTRMKKQGYSDEQIAQLLKERNISPKEINNSLNQADVKTAVDQEPGMQESIMKKQATQEIPSPGQVYEQQPFQYAQQPMPEEGYQEQAYPQEQEMQQYYPEQVGQGYYQYPEYADNTTEITEEIVAEKMKEIKKQISQILNLKGSLQNQIKDLNERLKRIENIMDEMQMKILGKISDYGKDIEDINKEMQLMQGSFSKMINPVLDKKREKTIRKTSTHKKDNFEKYLR